MAVTVLLRWGFIGVIVIRKISESLVWSTEGIAVGLRGTLMESREHRDGRRDAALSDGGYIRLVRSTSTYTDV